MTAKESKLIKKLEKRIEKFVPYNKNILTLKNAFDLFDIPNFTFGDLVVNLRQANEALSNVQNRLKK